MSFRDRFAAAWKLLPASRLLLLAAFAVSFTVYMVYRSFVEFVSNAGTITLEDIGRTNIAIQALDATTIVFGLLVFLGAGVVAVAFLMRRPSGHRSIVAQLVWVVLIVGAVYFARATS